MMTPEADQVAEARMLLHQALRLLDDLPFTRDAGARERLADLAADLADEAVATLRASDVAAAFVIPPARGWPG